MSEHIWEEMVQAYLTTNRAVLVSRQYEITDDSGWEICPDLLAIDFRAHNVWTIEVSTASNANKITSKAKDFKTGTLPRLKNRLAQYGIVPDASNWNFGFWAFARKDVMQQLVQNITPYVDSPMVTLLEHVAFSWEYWDKRRAEESLGAHARGAAASN